MIFTCFFMFNFIYVLKCRNFCYDYLLLMKVSGKKAQDLIYAKDQSAKENSINVASKMLNEGLDIELISKMTNLSKEEIENLK